MHDDAAKSADLQEVSKQPSKLRRVGFYRVGFYTQQQQCVGQKSGGQPVATNDCTLGC
jgi:hypothetical protein